jgi:hypothetical protein
VVLGIEHKPIVLKTAKQWLKRLGFKQLSYKKGIYYDGHERKDVIDYWNKLLKELEALDSLFVKYDNITLKPIYPTLPAGQHYHHAISHGECGYHCGEQESSIWIRDDQQALRKKGQSKLIHVLDFVIESHRQLCLTPNMINALPKSQHLEVANARKIIYPRKNADPYWNMEQLLKQVCLK